MTSTDLPAKLKRTWIVSENRDVDTNKMLLDAAVEYLIEALESGVNRHDLPRRLSDEEADLASLQVERVQAAIHPLRLPSDIERFWTAWEVGSFGHSIGSPWPIGPEFALDSTLANPDWPRALFVIAYESHEFLAVELEYPGSHTSALYEYGFFGPGVSLVAPNFATWISACAANIEAHPDLKVVELLGRNDRVYEQCREALLVAGIDPADYGPHNGSNIFECPQRWQHQQGIDHVAYELRGSTHSISELQDAQRHGPIKATIRGQIRPLGGSEIGQLMRVTDGTGQVEVLIPPDVTRLVGGTDLGWEFEVIAYPLSATKTGVDDHYADHAEIQRLGLMGDSEGVAEIIARHNLRSVQDFPVIAHAFRPIR